MDSVTGDMMRCRICKRKLVDDERKLCRTCFEYFLWLSGGDLEEVENMIAQHNLALKQNGIFAQSRRKCGGKLK